MIHRLQRPRRSPALLAGLLLAALPLAACRDSGGRARTTGATPPPGRTLLEVDFGLRRDLHFGPRSLVGEMLAADLDGDGVLDLVQSTYLLRKLVLALGQPDGTFVRIAEHDTVGNAFRLASGDVDGDGLLDVAVACQRYRGSGAPAVQLFRQGPAPGEFSAPPVTFDFAQNPIDLAFAPRTGLSGDVGPDELFVAVRRARAVVRLEWDAGQLARTGALDSSALGTAGGPFSLALLDLGGEGRLDLVVGEDEVPGEPDRVVQYARTASGFQPAALVTQPTFEPIVDAVGDVDGNGFEDVSVAQLGAPEVLLLAGDGAGLSRARSIDFETPTTSLLFRDLNGDGQAEAIATTLSQDSIQIRRAVGPMVFADPIHYNVGPVPRALEVVFLPGDAIPDLLCANADDLSILIGVGGVGFRSARGNHTFVQGPTALETGDLDGDGDADAVAISHFQSSLSFLEGLGDGTLRTRVVLPLVATPEDEPGHVALSDVDADGDLDVLTTVLELAEVRVYRNPGEVGGFVDPLPADVTSVGREPLGIAMADVNGDTMPDALVAGRGEGALHVLLNTGTGALEPAGSFPVPFAAGGIAAMDLDADGEVDVALAGAGASGDVVGILRGDGAGGFQLEQVQPLLGDIHSMSIADMDGDGLPEIVAGHANLYVEEVMVMRNQGDLAFASYPLTVAPGPAVVVIDDLDQDGLVDLLVGTTQGELKFAFDDGAGGFRIEPTGRGELGVPNLLADFEYTDLNGDSLPDLLMVSRRTPFAWTALNASVEQ